MSTTTPTTELVDLPADTTPITEATYALLRAICDAERPEPFWMQTSALAELLEQRQNTVYRTYVRILEKISPIAAMIVKLQVHELEFLKLTPHHGSKQPMTVEQKILMQERANKRFEVLNLSRVAICGALIAEGAKFISYTTERRFWYFSELQRKSPELFSVIESKLRESMRLEIKHQCIGIGCQTCVPELNTDGSFGVQGAQDAPSKSPEPVSSDFDRGPAAQFRKAYYRKLNNSPLWELTYHTAARILDRETKEGRDAELAAIYAASRDAGVLVQMQMNSIWRARYAADYAGSQGGASPFNEISPANRGAQDALNSGSTWGEVLEIIKNDARKVLNYPREEQLRYFNEMQVKAPELFNIAESSLRDILKINVPAPVQAYITVTTEEHNELTQAWQAAMQANKAYLEVLEKLNAKFGK